MSGDSNIKRSGSATVPEFQGERNETFLAAVRAGDARTAAKLARAPVPDDATEVERARWKLRRRLYRRQDREDST